MCSGRWTAGGRVVCAIVLSCLPACSPQPTDPQREESAVLETVYRLALNGDMNATFDVCFLSFIRAGSEKVLDPPDDLVARLDGIEVAGRDGSLRKITIKKGSQSDLTVDRDRGKPSGWKEVTDKETGQPGSHLLVRFLKWNGDGEVEYHVGMHHDPLAGSAYSAKLKREDGKWVISDMGDYIIY